MMAATTDQEAIQSRLRGHVHYLAGEVGERNAFRYQNLERSRRYIEKALSETGYEVTRDLYRVNGRDYYNVVARKAGTRSSEKILVVGAHYDTAEGTPGADDNASGVAVLLELARLAYRSPSRMSLRFVAFTLEEPPYFRSAYMGSRVHARKAKERKDGLVGMVSLEMVGYYSDRRGSQGFPLPLMHWFYPAQGNFIAVAGNFRSRHLVRKVAGALLAEGQIPVEAVALPLVPGVGLSDNWSFWKEGYPALMVTDTAFFRNPHYHQLSDLPHTLNYERMAALVVNLAKVLLEIDW